MLTKTPNRSILFSIQCLCVANLAIIALFGGIHISGIKLQSPAPWAAALLLSLFIVHSTPAFNTPTGFLIPIQKPERLLRFSIFSGLFIVLAFGILRILTLNTGVFDAGFVFQSVFQGFSSPLLRCDVCMRDSFLGEHQSWTLLVLTPITWVFSTPLVFPFLTAGFGFLTLAATLRYFQKPLGASLSLFLVIALFSVRGFRGGFLYDFREDLIGCFFLVVAILSRLQRKYVLSYAMLTLGVFSKETLAILAPITLLSFQLQERSKNPSFDKKRLLIDLIIGNALFVLMFYFLMPYWKASDMAPSNLVNRLGFLGSSPNAIFENLVLHPIKSIKLIGQELITSKNIRYFAYTALPFIPFMLRSWNFIYLPGFFLLFGNMVSKFESQTQMQFHYDILLIPFFMIGMALSLLEIGKRKIHPLFLSSSLTFFMLVSGTWPMSYFQGLLPQAGKIEEYRWIRKQVNALEPDTVLLASDSVYSVATTHPNLRALLSEGFVPDDRSWFASGKLSEATHSILTPNTATSALRVGTSDSEWDKLTCSANGSFCLYLKKPISQE